MFFSIAKFALSPGVCAAGPCCAEVLGAEALPGVGASIRAECALPQFGQAPELLFKSRVVS